MEISRLKWPANHPILPDLDINLLDDTGIPYKTIIIAGDNGLGKSTILRDIHYMIMGEPSGFEAFEYNLGGGSYVATQKDDDNINVKKEGGKFEPVQLVHKIFPEKFGQWQTYGDMDDFAPQNHSSFLSNTSTDFFESEDNGGKYSSVKNHLITLERQDNEKYRQMNSEYDSKGLPLMSVADFNSTLSQVEKFRCAFDKVYDVLKFDKIMSEQDNTRVLFTKTDNEEIDIDDLSTGEKQVVFRASSVLAYGKDAKVVLVDEPELGMHPRWISKMLPFYQDLLKDPTTGNQKSQLFVTTHSDFIIREAVKDKDILIVRLTKSGKKLICNKPDDMVLNSPTAAEINYVVFGISSSDYHIQLFSQLHNEIISNDSKKCHISDADKSIRGQSLFNIAEHLKKYEYVQIHKGGKISTYDTLPAYVRNCIDHPGSPDSSGNVQEYDSKELESSIKLLRNLIKAQKAGTYDYTK